VEIILSVLIIFDSNNETISNAIGRPDIVSRNLLLLGCRRFEMDREPKSARYCAECNRLHPAEEGDFWAESSMLGLKITYFALMDGKVYDITGTLLCSRNLGSYLPCVL
jgi:hypothetical protein